MPLLSPVARRLSAVLALLAAMIAAPAVAAPVEGPPGLRFYAPPKQLTGQPGDLVWARAVRDGNALRSASRTYLVLYRSTSVDGRPIAVSGTVAIPKGKAPKRGWPVVSWAHGTTGAADICAPSRNPDLQRGMDGEFNGWLKAGHVVARTDYEGLGTPGPHPYLIGESAGRSLVDIVTAAGQLDPRVGRRWAAAGVSQGGHAALWAAAIGERWAPKLELKGVDALAPASHIEEQVAASAALTEPSALSVIGSLLVSGILAGYPADFSARDMLAPAALELLPEVEERCTTELGSPDSWGGIAPAAILRAGYDRGELARRLRANDPRTLKLRVPALVQQGSADTLVFPAMTDAVVAALEASGARVDYRTYPGADHNGVVAAGRADTDRW
ncbi:MAG TPA: lipase family protein, partial [Capillimicrobium sp.]